MLASSDHPASREPESVRQLEISDDPAVLLAQFQDLKTRAELVCYQLHAATFRVGDRVLYTSLQRKGTITALKLQAQVRFDTGELYWEDLDQYLIHCEASPVERTLPHEDDGPDEANKKGL